MPANDAVAALRDVLDCIGALTNPTEMQNVLGLSDAEGTRILAIANSAAPPPDAARQEGEDKHPLYVLRQFDAMDPVGAEASHFIMAAPLRVIKAVLSLHNDAVQRVTCETAGGGRCTLHRSSASPIWGGAWHFTIQKKGS
jgi:hypothetical protein